MVERILGVLHATGTISRDHVEVGKLTKEMRTLIEQLGTAPHNDWVLKELRRVLYGLYAIVKVHFAKE